MMPLEDGEARVGTKRVQLRDVNAHLVCVLCSGYLVDATTIIECMHSFCRTCIVRYLETSRFCPICDVLVHKAKPLMHIRPDKMLQAIVYKIVPGLFHSEVRKRRDFWAKTREPAVGAGGGVLTPEEEAEEEEEEREEVAAGAGGGSFFSAEDSISLSLEYYDSERAAAEEEDDDEEEDDELEEESEAKKKAKTDKCKDDLEQMKVMRRYLKCPAAVTMLHLKKFIRMKYGIGEENRVDVIYKDECLPDEFSLMDVAYTFSWRRKRPMRFSYRIFKKAKAPVKRRILRSITSNGPQTVVSSEGEPPEDGTLDSMKTGDSPTEDRNEEDAKVGEGKMEEGAEKEVTEEKQEEGQKRAEEEKNEEMSAKEEEIIEEVEKGKKRKAEEEAEEPPKKITCVDEGKEEQMEGKDKDENAVASSEKEKVEEGDEEIASELSHFDKDEVGSSSESSFRLVLEEEDEVEEEDGMDLLILEDTDKEGKSGEEDAKEDDVKSDDAKSDDAKSDVAKSDVAKIEDVKEEEKEEKEEAPKASSPPPQPTPPPTPEKVESKDEDNKKVEMLEVVIEMVTPKKSQAVGAKTPEGKTVASIVNKIYHQSQKLPNAASKTPAASQTSKSAVQSGSKATPNVAKINNTVVKSCGVSPKFGSSPSTAASKQTTSPPKSGQNGSKAGVTIKPTTSVNKAIPIANKASPSTNKSVTAVNKVQNVAGKPLSTPKASPQTVSKSGSPTQKTNNQTSGTTASAEAQVAANIKPNSAVSKQTSPASSKSAINPVSPKPGSATSGVRHSPVQTTVKSNTTSVSSKTSPVAAKVNPSAVKPVSNSSSAKPTQTMTNKPVAAKLSSSSSAQKTANPPATNSNSGKTNTSISTVKTNPNVTMGKPNVSQGKTNSSVATGKASVTSPTKVSQSQPTKSGANDSPVRTSASPIPKPQTMNSQVKVSPQANPVKANSCNGSAAQPTNTIPPMPGLAAIKRKLPEGTTVRRSSRDGPLEKKDASTDSQPPPPKKKKKSSKGDKSGKNSERNFASPNFPVSFKRIGNHVQPPPMLTKPSIGKASPSLEDSTIIHDDYGALDLSGRSSRKSESPPAAVPPTSASPTTHIPSSPSHKPTGTPPPPPSPSKSPKATQSPHSILSIAQTLVNRQLSAWSSGGKSPARDSPTPPQPPKTPPRGHSASSPKVTSPPPQGQQNASTSSSSPRQPPPAAAMSNLMTLTDTAVQIRNLMAAQRAATAVRFPEPAASNTGTPPNAHPRPAGAPIRSTNPSLLSPLRIPVPPVSHHQQQQRNPRPVAPSPPSPALPSENGGHSLSRNVGMNSRGGRGGFRGRGSGPMPRLHELFPGKPGPNQGVRQIPNPSLLTQPQNRMQGLGRGQHDQINPQLSIQPTSLHQQLQQQQARRGSIAQPKPPYAAQRGPQQSGGPQGLPPSSIRNIENLTRSIEKVAAGLSVRAVESRSK